MLQFVRRVLANDDGATAIEYAFVTMFISVIFIATLEIIGTQLSDMYQSVANGVVGANAG